jgi:hypothetical protein
MSGTITVAGAAMHMGMPHKTSASCEFRELHYIEAQITMSRCTTTLQAGGLRRFQLSHFWLNHKSQSSNAHGHAPQNNSIMGISCFALH